jgi:hypothetical protein
MGRVRGGYPRVSILVPVFCPRFCGFGYPKYRGFGADTNFCPWCSIGPQKMQPTKSLATNPKYISLIASLPQPQIVFSSRSRTGRGGTGARPHGQAAGKASTSANLLPSIARSHPHRHGGWRSHSGRGMPSPIQRPDGRPETSPTRRFTGLGAWLVCCLRLRDLRL